MKMRGGLNLGLAALLLAGCATGAKNYSHYDMGVQLRKQGKVDEAIEEFQKSLQIDALDPAVYDALGDVYYAKGFRDQAIAAWERVLSSGSTDPAFYAKTTPPRKVEWIQDGISAVKAAPDKLVKAYMEQAADMFEKGAVADAAGVWGKVTALKKDNLEAWKLEGKAYKKLKDLQSAYIPFKTAATLSPKDWELQKEYGYAAFATGHMAEAEGAFKAWTDLDSNNPVAYNNLGAVLAKLERYDEAYASYDKALLKQPDMLASLNGKATAYYYQKDYPNARKIWGHVLEIAPDDPTAKENIRTLVKMGY